jgi:hypothetical protein
MLSVVILSVIILSVVMLSVVYDGQSIFIVM